MRKNIVAGNWKMNMNQEQTAQLIADLKEAMPSNDASVMIAPGLEARLGFANDNGAGSDDVQQINGWLAWNPGDLTLAIEFDAYNLSDDSDGWDMMLLGNYQFSDFFGATLRYAHMDYESLESDRITIAALFSITDNFGINLEYSHTDNDGADDDEFYLQALLNY